MTIDQIIAHELLGLRSVSLPFVGTLSAYRVGVQRVDDGSGGGVQLFAPGVELSLAGDYLEERSILVLLRAYFPELDEESATLLYNQWVEAASGVESDFLVIRGVCRISTVDFSLWVESATMGLLRGGRTLLLSEVDSSDQDRTPLRSVRSGRGVRRRVVRRVDSDDSVRVWPAALVVGGCLVYLLYVLFGEV